MSFFGLVRQKREFASSNYFATPRPKEINYITFFFFNLQIFFLFFAVKFFRKIIYGFGVLFPKKKLFFQKVLVFLRKTIYHFWRITGFYFQYDIYF